MAKRKPANPNTAYGRRRLMEEAYQAEHKWRAENPDEAKKDDFAKILVVIIVIGALIGFAIMVKQNSNNSNDFYGPRGGHYRLNSNGNKEYYKNGK